MSALDVTDHLLNFALPAFFMAVALAGAGRVLFGRNSRAPALWAQAGINFLAGLMVLVGGLWIFGSDGRMATYAALAVVCGTGQWLLSGAHRR